MLLISLRLKRSQTYKLKLKKMEFQDEILRVYAQDETEDVDDTEKDEPEDADLEDDDTDDDDVDDDDTASDV